MTKQNTYAVINHGTEKLIQGYDKLEIIMQYYAHRNQNRR